MTQASRLRMPPLLLRDEENTVEESEEKAGLRERVKNALNELRDNPKAVYFTSNTLALGG